VSADGFGDPNNAEVTRLTRFGRYLYAGTANDISGAEMWRSANGTDWSQVNTDGFGSASNTRAYGTGAFGGYLYVGTQNTAAGAQIWRCATCDGLDWTQVVDGGFGDPNNQAVGGPSIVVFADTLYAPVDNPVTGAEVWRSSTGDPGSWTQCNADGFSDDKNSHLFALIAFDGYLYAATAQWAAHGTDTHTGVEVWRTSDGTTWNQVNTDGFGDRDNFGWLAETYGGHLYVSCSNLNKAGQIWRCARCDGTDWARVVNDGFGDINNRAASMLAFHGRLYAFTWNDLTGAEVWQTANGTDWGQVNVDGFGDPNNGLVYGAAAFHEHLYVGTADRGTDGGAVWMMLDQVYLPSVLRNHSG